MKRIGKNAFVVGLAVMLTVGAGALMGVSGVGTSDSMVYAKTYIGEQKAKEIALENAGVNASEADHISAYLDLDDVIDDYDVEIIANGIEYDYEINALTGAIIEQSREKIHVPDKDIKNDRSVSEATETPAITETPAVTETVPSEGVVRYDDWDDRYDDDWDDRYDDDWDDGYDDDWDDRYDDDWDDDWDD